MQVTIKRRVIIMSNVNQKEKKLISLREALEYIPISRSHIYNAAKRGDIEVVRLGRRIFVRADYLNRLLTSEHK